MYNCQKQKTTSLFGVKYFLMKCKYIPMDDNVNSTRKVEQLFGQKKIC